MFILSILADTIRVLPADFDRPVSAALLQSISTKYSNKVIPSLGLVISPHSLLSSTEGTVLYGDGCLYYKTKFTLVVYKPFVGEAMIAELASSTNNAVRLTQAFFSDIYIPATNFPPNSAYDPSTSCHFWVPEGIYTPSQPNLFSYPPDQRLYLEKGDVIRFRVVERKFEERVVRKSTSAGGEDDAKGKAAMSVTGTIAEPGLGNIEWWKGGGEGEEGGGGDEEGFQGGEFEDGMMGVEGEGS